MKKTIDQMSRFLELHNISLPEGARKFDYGDKTEDHERKVGFSKYQAFLINSGASNHMVASKSYLSSLNITDDPSIHMGDDTQIQAKGKGHNQIRAWSVQECSLCSLLSRKFVFYILDD